MGAQDRRPLARSAAGIPQPQHLLATLAVVGGPRRLVGRVATVPRPTGRAGPTGLERKFCGREFCACQKGGACVGPTKRGKGTKWMVVVDGQGVPLGKLLESASPAEVKLLARTLATVRVPRVGPGRPRSRLRRVIADKGYDSDRARRELQRRGGELICPHRKNRRRPPLQDGRKLRRYRKRWKVERTFAWLGNYRRLVVRYEHKIEMYSAFFHVACLMITLRHL